MAYLHHHNGVVDSQIDPKNIRKIFIAQNQSY